MPPALSSTNDLLIELLALADACRRAGGGPLYRDRAFFGYARADRQHGRREPITARMVADLLELVGIDHVVTFDLRTAQPEGFFHVPPDSLTALPTLCPRRGAVCIYDS